LLVTDFWRVRKLILSSIIGHHGLVAKKIPFREAAGTLNKKIIDSLQRINPQAKIITLGDLNDGAIKVSKWLLAPKPKKQMYQLGIYNPFEDMAKRFWNHCLS
jgi:hypothetical protein